MNALKENGTWEIVEFPINKKPAGCKWVFTIKCNADNNVERYKSRLVAKGFTRHMELIIKKYLLLLQMLQKLTLLEFFCLLQLI